MLYLWLASGHLHEYRTPYALSLLIWLSFLIFEPPIIGSTRICLCATFFHIMCDHCMIQYFLPINSFRWNLKINICSLLIIFTCTFLPLYWSCFIITDFYAALIIWNIIRSVSRKLNTTSIIRIAHSFLSYHTIVLFSSTIDINFHQWWKAYPPLYLRWIMLTWGFIRNFYYVTVLRLLKYSW